MRTLPLIALLACGGDSTDSTPTEPTGSFPTDSSEAGIAAWLASGAHKEAPWVAETEAPRDRTNDVSPHDRVRVWFNDVLADSQAAGNGQMGGAPHPTGAMVVKELYDASDALLGNAVMLKVEGDPEDWVYYCDESASRCGDSDVPTYGIGLDTDCGFCHGGLVFNTL